MYIFQINYIPTCFTVYFLDHFQTLAATFSAANLAGEHFGGRVRDDAWLWIPFATSKEMSASYPLKLQILVEGNYGQLMINHQILG